MPLSDRERTGDPRGQSLMDAKRSLDSATDALRVASEALDHLRVRQSVEMQEHFNGLYMSHGFHYRRGFEAAADEADLRSALEAAARKVQADSEKPFTPCRATKRPKKAKKRSRR